MIKTKHILLVLTIITSLSLCAYGQKINEPQDVNPEWSQPYQPFRLVGDVYYVGTYDLACYLIVTSDGNILINTGLAASASMIRKNIETLGFKVTDIKILLNTQAHYDHVGAMAALQKLSGAKMLANEKDAKALTDGGISDYELGKFGVTFEPIHVDGKLKNGDTIKLGAVRIIMLDHPGHTKGSSSFLLNVNDKDKTYRLLIANMPSIITNEKFSDISSYPDIANDYAYTLESLKRLTFDLWLSSHASQFGLHAKHKPGDVYNPQAFSDRDGYTKSVSELEKQYLKKLEQK